MITPGYSAMASCGMPSAFAIALPCCMKPVRTIEELGNPALSLAMLARTTAGVQLPQPPTPEITASQP
jgi:hypothetical protein